MAPLERRFVKSIDRFVQECMRRTDGVPIKGIRAAMREMEEITDKLLPDSVDGGVRGVTEGHRQRKEKRFLYLRAIFREYELYCLEHDLRIEPNRDKIQRQLIAKYGARMNQLTVDRIRGLKWDGQAVERLQTASTGVADEAGFRSGSLSARPALQGKRVLRDGWLGEFIDECCVVTKQPFDWLDLKTRPAPPDAALKMGFEPMLRLRCRKRNKPMPDLSQRQRWVPNLPAGVYFRDHIRVRQVHGLEFRARLERERDGGDYRRWYCCSLHGSWYVFEAVAVLVHVTLILLAPFLLSVLIMTWVNHEWALESVPFDGSQTVSE